MAHYVRCLRAMRALAVLLLTGVSLPAQFQSTVPLVVAPTTVSDAKGRAVDGLTARDLVLYDNNVPQTIQVDTIIQPISLVVAIETSLRSAAILDKLGRTAILFSEMLAGEKGETAVVSFSDRPSLVYGFTSEADILSKALRGLRVEGHTAALLDGVMHALRMLEEHGRGRRRVILVIAERRDRGSRTQLSELLREAQVQDTAIYWLSYSTALAPYTSRPKTVFDTMTDEQKDRPERMQGKRKYPRPELGEDAAVPPELESPNLLRIFTELKQRSKVDTADLLSRTTGGRTFSFLKQRALENAIQAVAEEVHRQYILSFQPKPDGGARFHAIRVAVRGRPDLEVRTRAGYWSVP